MSKIPKGKVMTYKQVALLAEINPRVGGPRVVGFAMRSNKNPKTIPCHRVVGNNGRLIGYAFGGIIKKEEILKKEGVFFINNETVNLEKSLYKKIN